MLLHVGTVISLLKEKGLEGSLIMSHNSIENLSDNYTQYGFNKDTLPNLEHLPLHGIHPFCCSTTPFDSSAPEKFYRCGYFGYNDCRGYVTDHYEAKCPSCGSGMTSEIKLVVQPDSEVNEPTSEEGGYVKELVTYMVPDDLVVKPMSAISCIALTNAFSVKDIGALDEKELEFGVNEVIKLLQASLQSSKTVLTDAFLRNKGTKESP